MQGNFFSEPFWARFDSDGYIIATDYAGMQTRVGVNINKFTQLEKDANATMAKAEEYLQLLYQHGIKQRELTPDEKINALTEQLAKLTAYVGQLAGNSAAASDCGATQKQVITPEIVPPENNRGNGNAEYIDNSQPGSNFIAS